MPTAQTSADNQRKPQTKVKKRLTLYWKSEERAQIHEILQKLDVSLYRYVKDCVTQQTALVHAIKQANAPQLWHTMQTLLHAYGNFELNLNSIFAALQELIMVDGPTKFAAQSDRVHHMHKTRPIPLLRPEQQRTVELAGAALGPELKDAFKAFKVLEALEDPEE